jgi:hexosaminidase
VQPPVLTTCYNSDGTVAGTGNLDPSKESTFTFMRTLLAEVVPLFESGLFMVGGDEVPFDCWHSNPDVMKFVKAQGWGTSARELESYYAQRLLAILAMQNTSVMCWEDLFNNGLVSCFSCSCSRMLTRLCGRKPQRRWRHRSACVGI